MLRTEKRLTYQLDEVDWRSIVRPSVWSCTSSSEPGLSLAEFVERPRFHSPGNRDGTYELF